MTTLRIYAPASSANISVGFDSLGAAISPINGSLLGDVVQIEDCDQLFELESVGYFVRKLPKEPQKTSFIRLMYFSVNALNYVVAE